MTTKSPNPVDVHVGKRIRMRRMMLTKTQTDLAGTCGISFQQIQKYEKGTNRVSASRLQQFSKLLDVPVSFFFEGLAANGAKQKNVPEDLAQQLLATRDGIELTKAFILIDDKSMRRSIVAMVEEIAKQ
jgi:transcriptional regulator with XRE-family HTH domain